MKKSAFLLLMVLAANAIPAENPVKFADPNIKAVAEIMLKVTDPTPTQMRDLYVIQCRSKNVKDLAGIEYGVNLTELDLIQNDISDISVLAKLTELRDLGLDRNKVSDLSALCGLTNLKRLTLRNNQVRDISALAGLTNLEYLDLRDNAVNDISPLSGLTKLRYLNLNYNEIGDISALSRLTDLGALFLDCYYISDISALSQLKKLRTLHLNYNEISDIRPLSELTGLEYLQLGDNPLNKAAYETYLPLIRTNNPRIQLRYNLPRKDDALRPLVTSERPLGTAAVMAMEVVRARATSKAKIVKRHSSNLHMSSADGRVEFCRTIESVDCRQSIDVFEVVMSSAKAGRRVLEYSWYDSDTHPQRLTLEKPMPRGGDFILLLDEEGRLVKAIPDNEENIEAVKKALAETRTYSLAIEYHGPQDKFYYNLQLVKGPYRHVKLTPDRLVVAIDEKQVTRIAAQLERIGIFHLKKWSSENPEAAWKEPYYCLTVKAGEGEASSVPLGWGIGMYRWLELIRKGLCGEAAKAMDKLLARLAGDKEQWEKEVKSKARNQESEKLQRPPKTK